MQQLGIDIGGTFTDLVYTDGETTLTLKVPSTPEDPSRAALAALQRLRAEHGVDLAGVQALAHGTTVATNALLQRRGARTALLTTAGFRDVLAIARLGRPPQAIYDVHYQPPPPLVPRPLRLEVAERVNYRGEVVQPLAPEALPPLAARLRELHVESVAVCLLYSFLYPEHERRLKAFLAEALPGVPVLCSHEVLPERREYERTSTTVLSAYLAPTVQRYLAHLLAELQRLGLRSRVYVMQSNGGLNTPATATANPASLLLSGPAAGVVAAAEVGARAGFAHLISMDMGGTSFDVALVQDGRCLLRSENELEGMACNLPMLDITTIGAGGGSIAWLDAAGALRVGPQSAGAHPGPACYGQGGEAPTVTDADLLLGWLPPEGLLGGALRLDPARAKAALQTHVAAPLGLSPLQAAAGICRIVNANMAGVTRLVSVARGYDPRDFALVAFGGAGPLHAAAIARELDLPWVVVPRHPGLTSAAGLVLADVVHTFVQTAVCEFAALAPAQLAALFQTLEQRAAQALDADGVPPAQRRLVRSLDMKYAGQGYTLTVAVPEAACDAATLAAIAARFHAQHQERYGFCAEDAALELVNVRLQAIGLRPRPAPRPQPFAPRRDAPQPQGTRLAWDEGQQAQVPHRVYRRAALQSGHRLAGPAIIEQADATTLVPPGWQATVDGYGQLILGKQEWTPHG